MNNIYIYIYIYILYNAEYIRNYQTTKTKGEFIVALFTFYFSPLQYNDYFVIPIKKIACFWTRVILVFSQGALVINDLFGGICVYSMFCEQ